jgi:hypothetical protein
MAEATVTGGRAKCRTGGAATQRGAVTSASDRRLLPDSPPIGGGCHQRSASGQADAGQQPLVPRLVVVRVEAWVRPEDPEHVGVPDVDRLVQPPVHLVQFPQGLVQYRALGIPRVVGQLSQD